MWNLMDPTTRADLNALAALDERPAQQMSLDDWRLYDALKRKYAPALCVTLADRARIGELAQELLEKEGR